jgi:hypothetical protein
VVWKIAVARANENTGMEKGEKENIRFPNPAYIRRCGSVTEPCAPYTNICHVTDEYMGSIKIKSDGSYIRRFPAQTDEHNITFVGTDKFKKNNK